MRILVLSNFYSVTKAREAADVVAHQVIASLVDNGHDVHFASLNYSELLPKVPFEEANIKNHGLFHVGRPKIRKNALSLKSLLAPSVNKKFNNLINEINPRVIITVWSEVAQRYVAEYHSRFKIISLTGNLDHSIYLANKTANSPHLKRNQYCASFVDFIRSYFLLRSQLNSLKKITTVFNPALNDVNFLKNKGISHANYLPMTWREGNDYANPSGSKRDETVSVLLSVGNVSNTSNNLVYKTFLQEIAPHLSSFNNKFEFHIVGGGEIRDHEVARKLAECGVVAHGFIDDIDSFLREKDVALVLNCYTKFIVSHTRFLHCWELALPVVCWPETATAMPEIQDHYNCLFGDNGKQLLNQCLRVKYNENIRNRITSGGAETLKLFFNNDIVSNAVNDAL